MLPLGGDAGVTIPSGRYGDGRRRRRRRASRTRLLFEDEEGSTPVKPIVMQRLLNSLFPLLRGQ